MLLDIISDDRLQARKDGDKVKTTLLTTLYSEAVMIGKNDGNRQTTDDEVSKVIKKFIKNNHDFIGVMLADSNGKLSSVQMAKERELRAENQLLQSYLPKQLTEDELAAVISVFVEQNPDAVMGDVMKHLKESYNGQYDGKLASELIRGML